MTAKSLAQAFSELPPARQLKLVAAWAHALTVDARDTYIPGTEAIADPVRLRGFNEIQHRVVGQIRAMLAGSENRYPDEVFVGMVVDAARELRASLLQRELGDLGQRGHRRAG